MAIKFKVGAEETHVIGAEGAKRIRTWLDSTYRFSIRQSIYDLDQNGMPYTKMRVPQLREGSFERFDLWGQVLDEKGRPGNQLFVECKEYSDAGKQGTLYDEYLAVCYCAFVKQSALLGGPWDAEFMWATTHPFAVTNYAHLTTARQIEEACEKHKERLNGDTFDLSIAQQLESRLWLAIVNSRVEEMIMGPELQKAVVCRILELTV